MNSVDVPSLASFSSSRKHLRSSPGVKRQSRGSGFLGPRGTQTCCTWFTGGKVGYPTQYQNCYHTKYSFLSITFKWNYIFQLFPMNYRPFSLSSSSWRFVLNLVLFVGGILLRIFFRYHSPPISVKSVWLFLLKYSIVGVGFSVGFLELFHVLLIVTITPRKKKIKGIDPSAYEVNTSTKINERIYFIICW